jgi:hypothetical protein
LLLVGVFIFQACDFNLSSRDVVVNVFCKKFLIINGWFLWLNNWILSSQGNLLAFNSTECRNFFFYL